MDSVKLGLRFVTMLLLGVLVAMVLHDPPPSAEAQGGWIPPPCFQCVSITPIARTREKPISCGWQFRKIYLGVPYRFNVVCNQTPQGVWEWYLHGCPVCPVERAANKERE